MENFFKQTSPTEGFQKRRSYLHLIVSTVFFLINGGFSIAALCYALSDGASFYMPLTSLVLYGCYLLLALFGFLLFSSFFHKVSFKKRKIVYGAIALAGTACYLAASIVLLCISGLKESSINAFLRILGYSGCLYSVVSLFYGISNLIFDIKSLSLEKQFVAEQTSSIGNEKENGIDPSKVVDVDSVDKE